MSLRPGDRVGAFEIGGLLGAGGMGEVYEARDTRLRRKVAIKVLPAGVADDPDRLQRFEQEARAAAALNHPNILPVYDIGQHAGAPYIVAELLEGQTLRESLKFGPLPTRTAVAHAMQIAHGLAAAHDKGIVHRDLKPENIFITSSGQIRILDFGLAKLAPIAQAVAGISAQPTEPAHTTPGMVIGTVGYMSPEQVRSLPADHRSDIFSFGAVFYEMLTGRRAFVGETQADTLSAILTKEPPRFQSTEGIAPAGLERVVRRCIEKAPEQRFQSARDIAFAIDAIAGTEGANPTLLEMSDTGPNRRWKERVAWIAAATIAIIGVISAATLFRRSAPTAAGIVEFLIPAPANAHFASDSDVPVAQVAVSPDGRTVAFVATGSNTPAQLWVRKLDTSVATPIPGTENAMYPFWKPNSREIGFFAVGKLKKVSLAGGAPQDLASTSGQARGGTWNRDGTILFSPSNNSELLRVSENGGRAASVTTIEAPRETGHRWPHFLPDGKHFLYTTRADAGTGIFVASLESSTPKRLLTDFSNAMYDGSGYLLFVREGALVSQPFDAAALELRGEAVTVVDRIAFAPSTIFGAFSVSPSGVLAYARSGGTTTQLEWFDRRGRSLRVVGEPANYLHPRLSPDESRIAVARLDAEANSYDIWLVDAARQAFTKLTFEAANERFPVWSRDGLWIAFASPGKQTLSDLYRKSATATVDDELLLSSNSTKFPTDWSPDGRWIVYHGGSLQRNGYDLQLFDFETRKPDVLLASPFNELLGRFSPDGKWLSYVSDESGEFEVYLQPFRVPLTGERRLVSRRGGSHPLWSADGKELFYVASNSELMAVPIALPIAIQDPPKIGEPSPLFTVRLPGVGVQYGRDFAVSRDGSRFLVNTRLPGSNGSPITIVLNWSEALRGTP